MTKHEGHHFGHRTAFVNFVFLSTKFNRLYTKIKLCTFSNLMLDIAQVLPANAKSIHSRQAENCILKE